MMKDKKKDLRMTIRAIKSYIYHYEREFGIENDYFHLRGQDNLLRYLPVGKVMVRLHKDDSLFEVLGRISAVLVSGCELIISLPQDMDNKVTRFLRGEEGKRMLGDMPLTVQSDDEVAAMIPEIQRIRYAAQDRVPQNVFKEAAKTGFYISRTPVMMEGQIELLQYFQQQAVCNTYHRYGNLGERTHLQKGKQS